ncbi:MAG: hypothetical protein U0559_10345 [Anaerolineae bacterium]
MIGGFEINSETNIGHMDFLAYGCDIENEALQNQLLEIRDARVGRAKGMVKKLANSAYRWRGNVCWLLRAMPNRSRGRTWHARWWKRVTSLDAGSVRQVSQRQRPRIRAST